MKLGNIRFASRFNRTDFSQLAVAETFSCSGCEAVFTSRDALAMHRMEAAALGRKCNANAGAIAGAPVPRSQAQETSADHSEVCSESKRPPPQLPPPLTLTHTHAHAHRLDLHHHGNRSRVSLPAAQVAVSSGDAKAAQLNTSVAALQYAASLMSQWYLLWQHSPDVAKTLDSCNWPRHQSDTPQPAVQSQAIASDVGTKEHAGPPPVSERKIYLEVPQFDAGVLYFPQSGRIYCPRCEKSFSQNSFAAFIDHCCFKKLTEQTSMNSSDRRTRYRQLFTPTATRRYPRRPKSVQSYPTSTLKDETQTRHSFSFSFSQSSTPIRLDGESESESDRKDKKEVEFAHACKYCRIGFQNDVLYSLHSGCHNINNPLQCNRCGITFQSMNSFAAHTLVHG